MNGLITKKEILARGLNMRVQEVIDSVNNSVKDKSEKIGKDINGNPISTAEMIKILRGIQKDNGEDFEDDYSYFNW